MLKTIVMVIELSRKNLGVILSSAQYCQHLSASWGLEIFILRESPSRIDRYDSKKPHKNVGAFVRQVIIILLTALTIPNA